MNNIADRLEQAVKSENFEEFEGLGMEAIDFYSVEITKIINPVNKFSAGFVMAVLLTILEDVKKTSPQYTYKFAERISKNAALYDIILTETTEDDKYEQ